MKPLNDFSKDAQKKCGVRPECRKCVSLRYTYNRVKCSERSRKWSLENKDRKRELDRLWRVANYKRVLELQRKSYVKKYATPKGKISNSVHGAVYRCLRNAGGKRGSRTFDLLEYTVEELMSSLESKFKPGMSWENHGKWHIDHVRPIASYDFSSVDDPAFKECWSLANLQPLWAKENLSKGARYER